MSFLQKIGDFHCGLRGLTKSSYTKMALATSGMEFASEMIVKAKLNDLKIIEVPTKVFPSGRSREAHLQTWPDGWRHLRFLLLYSPKWLFFYPGFVLSLLGGVFFGYGMLIEKENIAILGIASVLVLIGFQFVLFYALTKIYATNHGLIPESKNYQNIFTKFTLERGLVFGVFLMSIGIATGIFNVDFSSMVFKEIKTIFVTLVSLCLGVQIILFSFFFSILGLKGSK